MRILNVGTSAVDLSAQLHPFVQGATVYLLSTGTGKLQSSDASGGTYADISTALTAGVIAGPYELNNQFLKSTSGTIQLIAQ